MKKAFLDASSAILLFKVNLFDQLVETYSILITNSVHEELTQKGYPGEEIFTKYRKETRLTVIQIPKGSQQALYSSNLSYLDQGERDTILCYNNKLDSFIITDDGRAARYCRENNIPFINALLFPRILNLLGKITQKECCQRMEELIGIGRYAPAVINFAKHCSNDDLDLFSP